MANFDFQPLEPRVALGARTGLSEAIGAGFESARLQGFTQEGRRYEEAYRPWRPLVSGVLEGRISLPEDLGRDLVNQKYEPDEDLLGRLSEWVTNEGQQYGIAMTPEMEPSAIMAARDEIWQRDRELIDKESEILSRASGGTALFGQLVGGVGAEFLDPVNLMTLPIGAPARAGFLTTVAIEAGINAAIEGLDTGRRNEILRNLGLEETGVLENMAIGAIFGAVATTGLKGAELGLGKGLRGLEFAGQLGLEKIGRMIPTRDQRVIARTMSESTDPVVRTIATQLERELDELNAAGADKTPEAMAEHEARVAAVADAIAKDEPISIPDRPIYSDPRPSILNGELVEVDPRALEVQPTVFQFKSDADSGGVTDKLRDVPEWRTERAGVVLVYEYADGTQAIADGHQRTALARRIMDTDPSQEIKLAAKVFREADGYTPEQVRVLAALKNISEAADGMTMQMARDAAKILRVDPAAIRDLPAGRGIIRAQELASLSDDAFALVINEVIPDRFAAIVGRLVPDPSMQMAVMRLLERTKPATDAQAEAIVRQAMAAPVAREVTEDLFGSQEMVESLFLERAKVLERATKILREDGQTFRVLNDRRQSIEGAGANKLDASTNAAMKKLMDEALYAVDKLAYRAGPISEALDNGARSYKSDGRLKDAATAVADAIRNELRANGFDGAGARTTGRPAKPQSKGGEAPDPNAGFADPVGGAEVDRQIAATRLDANERPAEGFSSDEEARRDLGRLVSSGASREEIDAHPAIIKALEELEVRAKNATIYSETYGSPEWHSAREYVFKDPDTGLEIIVTGTDAALPFWVREAEAFARGPVKADRRVTIILGPPAAGKSTIAEELAKVKGAAILDSDEIKKTLPEFEGGIGAAAVHEESSHLGDRLEAVLRAQGTNVVFPKVGKSPGSIRSAIERFKKSGYTVELVDMAVTPENAYRRMIGRFVSKGRLIPPSFVDEVGIHPQETYRTLKQEGLADGYAEIDNNGGLGEPKPVLDLDGENPLLGSSFDLPPGRGGELQPDAGGRGGDRGEVSGERVAEETPAGSQLLIDGVKPITARERIQTAADRPLAAPTRVSDSEIGGLFDAGDPARYDLFDQVPVGVRDVDGSLRAETVSRADLEAELAADDEFADNLGVCLK